MAEQVNSGDFDPNSVCKGCQRRGASARRMASLHRTKGNLVGTGRVQDRQGQCRGRCHSGDGGSTCDWGRVLVWNPYSRLVLSWDITADFLYDSALQTEIEVRFIAEGDSRTRVGFEHRRFDRYGDRRDEMRTIFDTTGDWGQLLAAFAQTAASSARKMGLTENRKSIRR